MDRNAPERRSGSFFKDRNGVPVHFLKIPNENEIGLLPPVADMKLRLCIEIAINDTSAAAAVVVVVVVVFFRPLFAPTSGSQKTSDMSNATSHHNVDRHYCISFLMNHETLKLSSLMWLVVMWQWR